MAGYGHGEYGTEEYGAEGDVFSSPYQWVLMIDWGGVEIEESIRLTGVQVQRGVEKITNGSGDGLSDVSPGRMTITLDNHDRRFDPRNASSPIYPNITNLTGIRLFVNSTATGTQYPVFSGTIDDIRPEGGAEMVVTITATDDLELLRQQTATTGMQFNITADEAIGLVAAAVGIDNGAYETSDHNLTVFAVENINALQAICDVTEASLGQVFVDRRGKLRYYSLAYDSMSSHNLDEDSVDKEIILSQPWDERYPVVAVYANRWARTASKVLWDYGRSLYIPSGTSVTVHAEWNNISSIGALVYSKIPYISAPGVLTNALSASISNATARSCDITVTNVSPWAQGTKLQLTGVEYVTGLIFSERRYQPGQKISGRLATQVSTKELFSAEDTTLPAKRRNKFVLDNQFVQDGNFAEAYATLLKNHLKAGLSTITVSFSSATSLTQQFGMELFDKVSFTAATLGVDDNYYLGAIRHEWQAPNVGEVRTILTLVKLLKSATDIDPEPIIDIPEELMPPPPDPGTLPPDNGGGQGCPADAPANGPFNLLTYGPNVLYSYGESRVGSYNLPMTIRNNVHTYRTLVEWNATIDYTPDGGITWLPTYGTMTFTVRAGSAVANNIGTGQYRFEIPSNISVSGITVEVQETSPVYLLGDVLGSGIITASDPGGTPVGLTVNEYYAIEGTGGPWNAQTTSNIYQIGLKTNAGYVGDGSTEVGVAGDNGAGSDDVRYKTENGGINAYDIDGTYGRIIFQALQNTLYAYAPDNPESAYAFHTGTIGYILRSVSLQGTYRVTFSSLTIRNICPA